MRSGQIVFFCLIGLSVLTFGWRPAAADRAPSPVEAEAMALRGLQTEFMVAALQCRYAADPTLAPLYNDFVRRFGKELIVNARVLRGFFRRTYGNAHQKRFDGWLTGLANAAALRGTRPEFCGEAGATLRVALRLDGPALRRLALKREVPEIAALR